MFPLPATNSPRQIWMPGAANAGFAVNAKTKNPNAIRFVRFVASPAFQNAFAKASGSLPAYPSTAKPDAGLALFVGYQKNGKTYPFPDQLWPNPKVQNAHLTGLQNIFAGQGTVAEMLRAMDQAVPLQVTRRPIRLRRRPPPPESNVPGLSGSDLTKEP